MFGCLRGQLNGLKNETFFLRSFFLGSFDAGEENLPRKSKSGSLIYGQELLLVCLGTEVGGRALDGLKLVCFFSVSDIWASLSKEVSNLTVATGWWARGTV